jgi:hypothetical protein
MITALLIIHGLSAVALLGALTHQALSVWWPARKHTGSFLSAVRAVGSTSYTNAIIVLFVITATLGAVIYPAYRLGIRVVLQDYHLLVPEGSFELKEHFVTIGLGLLPAYWYFWRRPLAPDAAHMRLALTTILAFIVWWSFLVGHVLNNIRGFGS